MLSRLMESLGLIHYVKVKGSYHDEMESVPQEPRHTCCE